MTPREPDRFVEQARALQHAPVLTIAAALRAVESSTLERAEKVCRAKAKRMRDYAAETLDKESIPKAEACADQAEDCGDAIRALASPAAAPAAETDAPNGPVCGCGRPSRYESGWCGETSCFANVAPPSGPAAPEKEIANLLGRGHVRNPREGEPGDAETYSSPAPLLPRVLAALEIIDRQGTIGVTTLIRSLAAELRAYIATAKGEGKT